MGNGVIDGNLNKKESHIMTHASDKRILVVDDEPDVRHFLSACLEDAGFIVETAVDGIDALEKLRADKPDLMTIDMVMPRKSGIRLMRTLRNEEKWADIPIIVITAHMRDEFGSEDVKAFNAFATRQRPKIIMEKPIKPKSLVKAIGDILGVDVVPTESGKSEDLNKQRKQIKDLINTTTPETLAKISDMLKS